MATIERTGSFTDDLRRLALLRDDGKLNDDGLKFLAHMLSTEVLPERHGPAFEPIKRAAGSVVAVEAVIIEPGRVLLSWREHPIFGKGWHTPGTYPQSAKGESRENTVRRCARDETGLEVEPLKQLVTLDHFDNPRFPDAPILYLCRVVGGEVKQEMSAEEPKQGDCRWFGSCPEDFLGVQRDYIPYIGEALRTSHL